MPGIKQLSRLATRTKDAKNTINWYPGHMFSGMQKMIGKLNTVDCIVEVHDARIPFTGRNTELKQQLGSIKPRVLVLNKSDLADLTRWDSIKSRLHREGDAHVFLTDLTGSEFSLANRGYDKLMSNVVRIVHNSDRFNRQATTDLKIMFVGIPNVGKSTLINRLRQQHLGIKGEPAKTGPQAGVTRTVENSIKICSRPPIYSLDTPGVLEPSKAANIDETLRLALCSSISDKVLKPDLLADYMLRYLNDSDNFTYQYHLNMTSPAKCLDELIEASFAVQKQTNVVKLAATNSYQEHLDRDNICWKLIRDFRKGCYGKVIFD